MTTRASCFAIGVLLALQLSLGCSRKPSLPSQPPIVAAPDDESPLSKPTTKVPRLAGIPRDWATQLLRLKELQGVAGRLYLPANQWQDDWAEGDVYLQTPQPETLTHCDTSVAFWTMHRAAEDDALIEVPNVVGKSEEDAHSELEQAGLTIMTVRRAPTSTEDASVGAVLDQFPRTPQVLGPSSTVLLHVATISDSN